MASEVVINIRAEDSFSGVLGNFGNILTGISSAVNLAGDAFRAFGDLAMQGLDAVASYERLTLSLTSRLSCVKIVNVPDYRFSLSLSHTTCHRLR